MLNLMKARRMVRNFESQPLDDGVAVDLIEAARFAPRAGNAEGIRYLLLENREVSDYWETTLKNNDRNNFPWPGLLQAPTLILIWVNPNEYLNRYSETDKLKTRLGGNEKAWATPYWWVDGGMAAMSILLAAESKGLGSLFFGLFEHEPNVKLKFNIPEEFKAIGAIAVGYASDLQRKSKSTARNRLTAKELIFKSNDA